MNNLKFPSFSPVMGTTTENKISLQYAQNNSQNIKNENSKLSIADEERFQKITNELRCLVCQNQTVADSNAGLAVDLKTQVAEQISRGKSDNEIFSYMEERYGEFVLYDPQISIENIGLWIGPFIVVFLAMLIAANTIKKHSRKKN